MKKYGYFCLRLGAVLLATTCLGSYAALGQPPRQHYITVADSKLYVEESGQGPAVMLLHAGLLDHRMWQQQVAPLSKRFRVINCDMRKHGLTVDGDSTFLNSTALALILDSLGIDKTHLIGLSLGAVAAVDLALAHPHRIDRLILAAPGLIGYDLNHDPALIANQRQEQAAKQRGDTLGYVESFVRSWTDGPRRTPAAVDRQLRSRVKGMVYDNLRNHQWRARLRFKEDPLPSSELGRIRSPTLVLVGDQDMQDIINISTILSRTIPQARRTVIPGAGHLLNLEKPVLFNSAMMSFLSR